MVAIAVFFLCGFMIWFIAMIPRSIYASIKQKKEQQLALEAQDMMQYQFKTALTKINAYGANMTTCVFEDRAFIFSVNTKEKLAYFSTSAGIVKTVSTSKIIGSEIRKNGKTVKSNGANEALAGALIGGRTGAVIGAVLAEEQARVTRYDLVIRLSDIRDSSVVYHIITQDTDESSPVFQRAQRFAERVSDVVYALVNENRTAQRLAEAAAAPSVAKITAPASSTPKITAPAGGITIKKIVCPNCESVQPIESKFCSNCGHKLEFHFAQTDIAAAIPSAAAAQDAKKEGDSSSALQPSSYTVVASGLIRCKKCGRTQSSKKTSCWLCGQSFLDTESIPEADLTAPSAISAQSESQDENQPVRLVNIDVQAGIGFCPKCGKKQKLGLDRCSDCGQSLITDI